MDKYGNFWITSLRSAANDEAISAAESNEGARNLLASCTYAMTEAAVRLVRGRLSAAAEDLALICMGRLGAVTAFVRISADDAGRLRPIEQAMRAATLCGGRALSVGVLEGDLVALFLRLPPTEQRALLYPNTAVSEETQLATAELASFARHIMQRVS